MGAIGQTIINIQILGGFKMKVYNDPMMLRITALEEEELRKEELAQRKELEILEFAAEAAEMEKELAEYFSNL